MVSITPFEFDAQYPTKPTYCHNTAHTLGSRTKAHILKLSSVAVVVALKLQHSIVICGGHHVDELGGKKQRTSVWVMWLLNLCKWSICHICTNTVRLLQFTRFHVLFGQKYISIYVYIQYCLQEHTIKFKALQSTLKSLEI